MDTSNEYHQIAEAMRRSTMGAGPVDFSGVRIPPRCRVVLVERRPPGVSSTGYVRPRGLWKAVKAWAGRMWK